MAVFSRICGFDEHLYATKPVSPTPPPKYSPEDLKKAVYEVATGVDSQNRVGQKYNIGKSVLSEHMLKEVDGKPKALKALQEQLKVEKGKLASARDESDHATAIRKEIARVDLEIQSTIGFLFKAKQKRALDCRKNLAESNRKLSEMDNLICRELHLTAAQAGVPFNAKETELIINAILASSEELEEIEGVEGLQGRVGSKYTQEFFKRNDKILKQASSSGIDPKRATKASPEVRAAMFAKLDSFVKLLHEMGKCPYPNAASIPADYWGNMDEVGVDTTKRRTKVTVGKSTDRAQQMTPGGDKCPFHVTICLFSKANGLYASQKEDKTGAVPPVVIHATKTDDKIDNVSDMYIKGMGTQGENQSEREAYETNEYGIKVLGTKNGSMTKKSFVSLARHIIYHTFVNEGYTKEDANEIAMGRKQVPYKFRMLLTIDGHSSRWNLEAIRMLMAVGIFFFYLPSHTSTWTQANDNGTNMSLHRTIEDSITSYRRSSERYTQADFNSVFFTTWATFVDTEHNALSDNRYGFNVTSNSYYKTGFFPFNPKSPASIAALKEFSVLNPIVHPLLCTQFEPSVREGAIANLTEQDKTELLKGTHCRVFEDPDDKTKLLSSAYRHTSTVLSKWRAQYNPLRDEIIETCKSKGDKSGSEMTLVQKERLQAIKPESFATSVSEKISLKLFEFELCDISTLSRTPPLTQDQRKRVKAEKILRATQLCKSVSLKKMDTNGNEIATGSATRISQDDFNATMNYKDTGVSVESVTLLELTETATYKVDGQNRVAVNNTVMERLRKREQRQKQRSKEEIAEQGRVLAKAQWRANLHKEYEQLHSMTQEEFTFERFLETADLIAKPLIYQYEDQTISVGHLDDQFAYINTLLGPVIGKHIFSFDESMKKVKKETEKQKHELEKKKKKIEEEIEKIKKDNETKRPREENADATTTEVKRKPRKRRKVIHGTVMGSNVITAEMDLEEKETNNEYSEMEKELIPQIATCQSKIKNINKAMAGFEFWKNKTSTNANEYWKLPAQINHKTDTNRLTSLFDPGLEITKNWSNDRRLNWVKQKFTSKQTVDDQIKQLNNDKAAWISEKDKLVSKFNSLVKSGKEDNMSDNEEGDQDNNDNNGEC